MIRAASAVLFHLYNRSMDDVNLKSLILQDWKYITWRVYFNTKQFAWFTSYYDGPIYCLHLYFICFEGTTYSRDYDKKSNFRRTLSKLGL